MSIFSLTNLDQLPDYISDTSEALLLGRGEEANNFPRGVLDYLLQALQEDSPWADSEPIDPRGYIEEVSSLVDQMVDYLVNLNPDTDWNSILSDAVDAADANLYEEGTLDDDTEAFHQSTLPQLTSSLNASMGALHAANAAEGSTLLNVAATLRRGHDADVKAHRSSSSTERGRVRAGFISGALQVRSNLQQRKVAALKDAAATRAAMLKDRMDLTNQYQTKLVEDAYNDRVYHLKLFPMATNAMAGTTGAPTMDKGPSKFSSTVSSTLSAYSSGMQIDAQNDGGTDAATGMAAVSGLSSLFEIGARLLEDSD